MKYLNPWADDARFIDLGQCLVITRTECIVYDLYALADLSKPLSIHDVSLGYRCSSVEEEYGSPMFCAGWSYGSTKPKDVAARRFVEYLLNNDVEFEQIDPELLDEE